MSARDRILARVRAAQRLGSVPRMAPQPPVTFTLDQAGPEVWRQRFVEEARGVGVGVFEEDGDDAVCRRVVDLVAGRSVLAWSAESLPCGLGGSLGSLTVVDPAADREVRATAEVGLTGCEAAIAETGTLALHSLPGCSRSASLLPPVHIAVVRTADLVPTLGAYFRQVGGRLGDVSCINLVTGPSRTADIELELTLGVHGPGELRVVLRRD